MKKKAAAKAKTVGSKAMVVSPVDGTFDEIVDLIRTARQRAYQAVNTELVSLYWQIGKYISGKLAAAEWGEGVVDHLAQHLERTLPGLRGFTRRNLFRMRQVFDTYASDEKVSPLVTQLPKMRRWGRVLYSHIATAAEQMRLDCMTSRETITAS